MHYFLAPLRILVMSGALLNALLHYITLHYFTKMMIATYAQETRTNNSPYIMEQFLIYLKLHYPLLLTSLATYASWCQLQLFNLVVIFSNVWLMAILYLYCWKWLTTTFYSKIILMCIKLVGYDLVYNYIVNYLDHDFISLYFYYCK